MPIHSQSYGFESALELKGLLISARKPLKGCLRTFTEFSDGSQEEELVYGKFAIASTKNGDQPLFMPARWEYDVSPRIISENEFVVGGLGEVLSRRRLV